MPGKILTRLERRLAKRKSNRRKIYTRLSKEVLTAVHELSPDDPTEDFWMLHDLSGILYTVGLVDPVEGRQRLNTFLNQLRTLQGPIRDLCPEEPDTVRPLRLGKKS